MEKRDVPREFLGAFKRGHRRSSKEFIDEELSTLLLARTEAGCEKSRAELEWLTRFNNEYHKAVFVKGEAALHQDQLTDELNRKGEVLTFKKQCDARNYSRRMDVFTSMPLARLDWYEYWLNDKIETEENDEE